MQEELTHYSPSQLLRPMAIWMFQYIYLNRKQRRAIRVGWNAAFGTAVHGGIQAMLTIGSSFDEAVDSALMSYDFHDAPDSEPDEKKEKFRELIPVAIENGVDLLADQFGGAQEEQKVEVSLAGVDLPILGFIDLCSPTAFCEVKTKAPRMGAVKKDGTRGWSKASIPEKPQFEHLCQVAIYQLATGLTPHIAYVSGTDAVLFGPDNCEELQPDRMAHYVEEMRARAIRRQNLLQVSTDPKVLAGVLDPDFQHPFYWDDDYIEEAKALWKV
jgi:hypothetical protein